MACHRARAHESRRLEPCRFRERSHRGVRLIEDEAAHVAQAVNGRICPRHDAGVRRQGEGDLRCGVGEPNAARGQRIQIGRLGMTGGVAAQVVGAGGVNGDEQNIRVARR